MTEQTETSISASPSLLEESMYENVLINGNGTASIQDEALAKELLDRLTAESRQAIRELLEISDAKEGQILVIGCSSSEVIGGKIGKASIPAVANAILDGILPVLKERGIYLAAQCCEHLNRALVIDAACAERYALEEVCVRPMPKAGGSFAAAYYDRLSAPVAVESIRAHMGLDIGGTLIGMHLRAVAVPVRLSISRIGEANILCARTRPKYVGGPRAIYE